MKIIDTLYRHFGKPNVSQIKDNEDVLFCVKKTDKEKIYQVVFVDTSNRWCESNYLQYIESVVVDKYYQSEGYLQWNFYYYFITSKDIIQENASRKIEIENDESYCRKFVLAEEEFIEWINSFENISEISKQAISSDLYSTWVSYLREKKLYFVYNSEKYPNYRQPVEDYINGLPFDDIDETDSKESSDSSTEILSKIKELELIAFREYPKQRRFDLGSVNLVHGANAVGKTSFFDAIELVITGKLFYKTINEAYSIQLTDSFNTILKYPAKPSPYKKRDIDWYNSGTNRGNDLNGNFNKFNYYASDAAFQFKQDDGNEQNNLESLISTIALGREVNKLEERIVTFQERFNTYAENYAKQLDSLNEKLEDKNETIGELTKEQESPQRYKDSLLESLKVNYWKNRSNDDDEEFVAVLDNEIQNVKRLILNIASKNIYLKSFSSERVLSELNELKLKHDNIASAKDEVLQGRQKKELNLKLIERNRRLLSLIEELTLYFKHEQFQFLVGLEKNINVKTLELNKARQINELSELILGDEFIAKESENLKTIKEREEVIKLRHENLSKKYSETELKLKQLEEGIEELAIIISDIKSSGQSYLKLEPKADYCPLCNTEFSNEDLVDAIQKTQETFSSSIVLTSLKEEMQVISEGIEETNEQLALMNRFKHLAIYLFSDNSTDRSFNEIRASCEANRETLLDLTASLVHLNIIRTKFSNDGIEEDRFAFLKDTLEEQLSSSINTLSELDMQKEVLLYKQEELLVSNNQVEKDIEEQSIRIDSSFTSEIPDEEILLQRLIVLQEVESSLNELENYLEFPKNTLISSLLERINTVETVFETFKKAALSAKQNNQALGIARSEKEKIIAEIEILKPKRKNALYASDELINLLNVQSKKSYLSDYITLNKTDIVSIFKLIHTPIEFRDIKFSKQIILVTNDGRERTLSEISTGQRSALALSIFLSLNKKLSKGPNVLMFDDPVTYVDDMNVLSFFDYLRELVLKSKRQVFFATANDDLAFLFRKKFEFLEGEFIPHKLKREGE